MNEDTFDAAGPSETVVNGAIVPADPARSGVQADQDPVTKRFLPGNQISRRGGSAIAKRQRALTSRLLRFMMEPDPKGQAESRLHAILVATYEDAVSKTWRAVPARKLLLERVTVRPRGEDDSMPTDFDSMVKVYLNVNMDAV